MVAVLRQEEVKSESRVIFFAKASSIVLQE